MRDDEPPPPVHTSSLFSHFWARRLSLAWLLLAAIVSGAGVIVCKVAVVDAPPQGALFIVSDPGQDVASATITPLGGPLPPAPATTSSQGQAGLGIAANNTLSQETPAGEDLGTSPPTPAPTVELISVYVSGAVNRPGVYTLPLGSRIDSAVAAAGGALPDADLEQINLAERVSDEAHIRVYHLGETVAPTVVNAGAFQGQPTHASSPTARPSRTPPGTPAGGGGNLQGASRTGTPSAKSTPRVKININTATVQDLEQVPGIGPVIAQRIIADRKQNGPYKAIEDLMRISGIKEEIVAKLRDYVTVGP